MHLQPTSLRAKYNQYFDKTLLVHDCHHHTILEQQNIGEKVLFIFSQIVFCYITVSRFWLFICYRQCLSSYLSVEQGITGSQSCPICCNCIQRVLTEMLVCHASMHFTISLIVG